MKTYPFLFLILLLFSAQLAAQSEKSPLYFAEKEDVAFGLQMLDRAFASQYALKSWKYRLYGWKHDEILNQSLNRLQSEGEHLCMQEAHYYFKDYILSANDAHLGVQLLFNQYYFLPFTLTAIENRYFVSFSNIDEVPVGDEVLKIDGLSPIDFARANRLIGPQSPKQLFQKNNAPLSPKKDDWVQKAVSREHEVAFSDSVIPRAPSSSRIHTGRISIETRSHLSEINTTRNQVIFLSSQPPQKLLDSDLIESRSYSINGKKVSYIQLKDFSFDDDLFLNYIETLENYPSDKTHLVPLIKRSLCYSVFSAAKEARKGDAIIIDLRGNPGGTLHCLHFILSLFIDRPIRGPVFAIKNTQKNLMRSQKQAELYSEWYSIARKRLDCLVDDEDYCDFTHSLLLHFQNLSETTKKLAAAFETTFSEKKKGIFVEPTDHHFIEPAIGLDALPPLYILIDGGSTSAADIFPATLQSAQIAKVAGTLSCGATGRVTRYDQVFGSTLEEARITDAFTLIPEQNRLRIIEDIGVIPNIELKLSLQDLSDQEGELFKTEDPILQKLLDNIDQSIDTSTVKYSEDSHAQ